MRFINNPLVKIFVTLGLFALIAAKVDVAEAGKRLLSLPPLLAVATPLVSFFALLIQAIKTKILLPERSIGAMLRVNIISQVYSMVFLGQVGGEIAKAGYLRRAQGELHKIIAAVLFDRLTGLIGLLVLGLGGLAFGAQHFDPVVAPTLTATMALLLAALLAMFCLNERTVERLISWLPDRIKHQIHTTIRSTHVFSSSAAIVFQSIVMGVVFQAVIVANCAWLGAGLGIDLSPATWAVVICVMSLVLFLPISIGGIGLRDVTMVGMLSGFGVGTDQALALSLALLGLQLVMVIVGVFLMLLPAPRHAEAPPC